MNQKAIFSKFASPLPGSSHHAGFAVPLSGSGTKMQGVALVNQVRILDLEAQSAKKVGTAPNFVIDDALTQLQAILD